jgi:hypothetical protein
MVCYGPRIGAIIGAGVAGYLLLHGLVGWILHVAGMIVEIALITAAAVAVAVLMAWVARVTSRRRAALGACVNCRFRCQQPVITLPPVAVIRPERGHAQLADDDRRPEPVGMVGAQR